MNPYELAQRLIARFGKLLGLQALTLAGGTHSCALEFDGHITVTFEFHEPSSQMVLTSLLATPSDASETPGAGATALRLLMEANFVDYLHSGSLFGIEPQSGKITLVQCRSVTELDDAAFESLVEAFVNKAEVWKKQIEQVLRGVPLQSLLPADPRATEATGETSASAARPLDGAHIYG
jgi:hypothetical protein